MSASTSGTAAHAAPLALLAAGAATVVYALVQFWGANPEYLDRFLILAAAGYAANEARNALRSVPARPTRLGFFPLFAGCVAFPVGWFLCAQVGPKPVVLWWLTLAWLSAASGFVLVSGGVTHLRRFAFPLAFVLFALPIPNRVLVPLQFGLQSATTSAAEWTLPLLGVNVIRNGFVLSLPGGDLGVAEACSGVRSITALTAIAAFVAWHSGFGFVRGALLVLLSIPVVAGVNAFRVVLSGLLQEYVGKEYIRDDWHEGLGVVMVLLGLGLIVLLARLMTSTPTPAMGETSPPELPPESPPESPRRFARSPVSTVLLACAATATIASQILGSAAEREVVAVAPLEKIPLQLGRWKGEDLEVPADIVEMLTPDTITRRIYRDLGYEVHVWVIFWSSRNMVKGYHHPEVCWPNRGFTLSRGDTEPIPAGGGTIPVTVREFARGTERELVLYWTQEGRRIWSEEDEQRMRSSGDSHGWLGERLFRKPGPPTGRIVVLLGTQAWGDGATIRSQTLELAKLIGEELYQQCPWAAPPE